MKTVMQQLQKQYPFMKKVGKIFHSCEDPLRVLRENESPRTLILLCGVEGCGKTTFAQKYLKNYKVINLDDILSEYLKTHNFRGTPKENEELNMIFFRAATQALEKGITILDCANHNINFRITTLNFLKNYYDKVIVFVFNPKLQTIIEHIQGQIHLRMRPNLFQDVKQQYAFFQYQIQNHILELGVDEVYFLNFK